MKNNFADYIEQMDIVSIRRSVWEQSPLIHCITNPISINDCANAVLAVGAKPIMAEHPDEAAEITAHAGALALNIGNITDARLASIKISADTATRLSIPFILDMVGITCSTLRLDYVKKLLDTYTPSVIKGNLAEIKALIGTEYESIGIDAISGTEVSSKDCKLVCSLARNYGCVVIASGKTDIVSDGRNTFLIKNGSPKLPLITGTGCILNVLTASFLSVTRPVNAALTACLTLGISGEIAELLTAHAYNGLSSSAISNSGLCLGSFHIALFDALASENYNTLVERADAILLTESSI